VSDSQSEPYRNKVLDGSGIDKFECEWGDSLSTEQINPHFTKCKIMKKKYGKLFQNIDKLISKDASQIQDWANLKLLFKFLEGHIKMMITKEKRKPTHFKNADPHADMEISSNSPSHVDMNYEEEKIDSRAYPVMEKHEEEKFSGDDFYQEKGRQSCEQWSKKISHEDEKEENVAILEWYHFVHKDCLKKSVKKQYLDHKKVCCVNCKIEIPTTYLNQTFGREFIEELNDILFRKEILENNPDMVECTCKNLIQVEPGEIDYKQKGDDGNVISRQAAKNMAECRVRCNHCDRIFWSKCNVEPYHVGKTCEEFAEYRGADKCRFWLDKLKKIRKNNSPAFMAVCRKEECESNMDKWCDKQLECGHFCCGTRGEIVWVPCLDPDWVKANPGLTLDQTADDFCMICYMSGLGQAPSIQLDCKHIYHEECLMRVLGDKWSGPRINFEFIKCPNCKSEMSSFHEGASNLIREANKLKKNIEKIALKRAKHEWIDKDERLQQAPYNGVLLPYAVARLSYYLWFKCKKPYFGGLKSWENNQQNNSNVFKPDELVWGSCAAEAVGGGVKDCKKHGLEFIEFKCKFCCNISQWFCWGNTHFWDDCHTRQNKGDYVTKMKLTDLPQCKGKKTCPLKVDHPPNGKEEYALGWAICKNMKDNDKGF
jgi:hypothetical protein